MKDISITVRPNLNFEMPMRAFLNAYLNRKLTKKSYNKVILAFDEIFSNAIKYGSKKNSVVKINIGLETRNEIEYIFIEVIDYGGIRQTSADEILTMVQNDLNSDILRIRGRGISIMISKLCDFFELTDNEYGGITGKILKKMDAEND